MQKILLIIEVAGARPQFHIEVDAFTSIGACVTSLVEKLGYPRIDATGRPLMYQLRPTGGQQPLPNTGRFSDIRIHSGVHVVLEADGANSATMPVEIPDGPRSMIRWGSVGGRWNRRAFLALTLSSFAAAGLGVGVTTDFVQRYLLERLGEVGTPVPLKTQTFATTIPRGMTLQHTFAGHQPQTVRTVGWSPDGTMLASGGDDEQVIIWEPMGNVQQRIAHPAPVQALAWSSESQRLMTGAGTQVAFFKALTGACLARSIHRHVAAVSSVAWTPNNQMQAVSGGIDKKAVVWETTHYQPQIGFTRHTAAIDAVSWGSDGQIVASASQGGVVRVWNAGTAQEAYGFYQDAQIPMLSCSFAPTGSSLAVGGNDGVIRLWNGFLCQNQVGNADPMCQDPPLRLRTSDTPICSLAWSSDARYLAAGSDGSFTVWSPMESDFAPLFTVTLTAGSAVRSLAWSPDGSQIAVTSGSNVIVWKFLA